MREAFQSAARPVGAEPSVSDYMYLVLSLSLIYASLSSFCLRPWQIHKSWSIYPPSFPPRRSAHSARPAPRGGTQAGLFSIKIRIAFWYRFLADLGPSWVPLGGSFSASWASKFAQDGLKRRLESLSLSKTPILLPYYVFQYENCFLDPKTAPKTAQDRPKMAPRRS